MPLSQGSSHKGTSSYSDVWTRDPSRPPGRLKSKTHVFKEKVNISLMHSIGQDPMRVLNLLAATRRSLFPDQLIEFGEASACAACQPSQLPQCTPSLPRSFLVSLGPQPYKDKGTSYKQQQNKFELLPNSHWPAT
jgi:hypothetical protein